jgi:hypothetical protein
MNAIREVIYRGKSETIIILKISLKNIILIILTLIMSTYDMYFSKKNKNYMFNTLSQLILQETSYDIKYDSTYIELYRLHYPSIFDMIDTDEISILNKELINHIGEIILNKLKKPKTIYQKVEDKKSEIQIPEKKNIVNIYSIHRSKDSKNRFDFKIQLKDNHKTLSETKSFPKEFWPKSITLLKEQNSLFSNDTIFLRFNDTDNIAFKFKSKNIIGDDEYYTYECLSDDTIEYDKILNIEILNYLLMTPCTKRDIFKIRRIKNIKYENHKYTCVEIKDNSFSMNQEIGLLNKDKEYIRSVFSKHILDDYILIECEDLKDSKYILKMNQNISIQILV